jgi:hypothetical protein
MFTLFTTPILRLQYTVCFDLSLSRQVVDLPCGRQDCCMDNAEDMDVLFVMLFYCQLLTVLIELHLLIFLLPKYWHPLHV